MWYGAKCDDIAVLMRRTGRTQIFDSLLLLLLCFILVNTTHTHPKHTHKRTDVGAQHITEIRAAQIRIIIIFKPALSRSLLACCRVWVDVADDVDDHHNDNDDDQFVVEACDRMMSSLSTRTHRNCDR